MNIRIWFTVSVAAMACAATVPANAATLLFNFSGLSGTALFQLEPNPTPDSYSSFPGSDQFAFSNVAGAFGGVARTAPTIKKSAGS